jgi:hypothetical protein
MKIVNEILGKLDDIHVKLVLNPVETSWEKHGEIAIKFLISDTDGETVEEDIIFVDDFQHNKRYGEMNARAKEIADVVEEYMLTRKRGDSGETVSTTDDEK